MKTYLGEKKYGKSEVWLEKDGEKIPLTHLSRHNDGHFIWGNSANDGLDLALSILSNALGLRHAEATYQKFADEVISHLDDNNWELTQTSLRNWVKDCYFKETSPITSHTSVTKDPPVALNQLLQDAVNIQHLSIFDNQELSD